MFETGSVADGPSGWTQRSQQELPVHLNWRRSTREPGSHIGPSAQVACAVRRLLISIRQPSTRTSMRERSWRDCRFQWRTGFLHPGFAQDRGERGVPLWRRERKRQV